LGRSGQAGERRRGAEVIPVGATNGVVFLAVVEEDLRSGDGDEVLVARMRDGETRDAFGDLYRRYRAPLLKRVARKVGDLAQAEEIVQETFVRAWKAADRFGGPGRFYGWLCTISDRLVIDHWRRGARREEPVGDHEDTAMVAAGAEESLVAADEVASATSALNQLSPRYRRLLHLREVQGLSYRRVAEEMEMSEAAVETALFRARNALRARYKVVAGEGVGLLGLIAAMWRAIRRTTARAGTAAPLVALPVALAAMVVITVIAGGSGPDANTPTSLAPSEPVHRVEAPPPFSAPPAASTPAPVSPTYPSADVAPALPAPGDDQGAADSAGDATAPTATTGTQPPAAPEADPVVPVVPDDVTVKVPANPAPGTKTDTGIDINDIGSVVDRATNPVETVDATLASAPAALPVTPAIGRG
jgi:RNA polymerase sigma-70 factor (ECF subfamily)